MRNTALARAESADTCALIDSGFMLGDLQVFATIPTHDHEVVVLRGAVVVYDTSALHFEEIQENAFYVIERQRTAACMPWENWLRQEVQANFLGRWHSPRSPLKTSREVVQLVRWPRDEGLWGYRYAGGFRDGPMETWGACHGIVGKVVGIYRPV
jgi:hypothetical protein